MERLGEMRKGRRVRIEKGSRERIKKGRKKNETEVVRRQFEEGEEDHYHFPLLDVQLPQGNAVLLGRHEFPTRLYSIRCCSNEVLIRRLR